MRLIKSEQNKKEKRKYSGWDQPFDTCKIQRQGRPKDMKRKKKQQHRIESCWPREGVNLE